MKLKRWKHSILISDMTYLNVASIEDRKFYFLFLKRIVHAIASA